ncbi:MAG: monovalent cation/H(+) antiporter subunit G [Hyphomonadaceae bacterium]|nr:monovalent cation/H(+) antiporter subunit G [Hyphomonadaceae bacterium]
MDAMTAIRVGFGVIVAVIGLALVLGGALGLLRFPDVFTRLHAASVSDGPGAVIFLVGLAIMAPDWAIAVRVLMLALLIAVLAPLFAHLVAASAHAGGIAPITGRYTAPRPGAQRLESKP